VQVCQQHDGRWILCVSFTHIPLLCWSSLSADPSTPIPATQHAGLRRSTITGTRRPRFPPAEKGRAWLALRRALDGGNLFPGEMFPLSLPVGLGLVMKSTALSFAPHNFMAQGEEHRSVSCCSRTDVPLLGILCCTFTFEAVVLMQVCLTSTPLHEVLLLASPNHEEGKTGAIFSALFHTHTPWQPEILGRYRISLNESDLVRLFRSVGKGIAWISMGVWMPKCCKPAGG
jgi:hypothetical protein